MVLFNFSVTFKKIHVCILGFGIFYIGTKPTTSKIKLYQIDWLGLWCLTPLSTIFQLYRGG